MWYIHSMEHDSAMKTNEIWTLKALLSQSSQTQKAEFHLHKTSKINKFIDAKEYKSRKSNAQYKLKKKKKEQ